MLPKAPLVLDELIISKDDGSKIVRIEKFNFKCAPAFRIDDSFNIIDNV